MLTLSCFEFLRIEFTDIVRRVRLPVNGFASSCTIPQRFLGIHSGRI